MRSRRDWKDRHRLFGGAELSRAWGEMLGRIPWEMFITLTFDPKRRFPVNRELASLEAFMWLGLVGWTCRRPVVWAYATEQSRNGFWHIHVVLANVGSPNWRHLAGIWRGRNGKAAVVPVHSASGIALYTTKGAAEGGEVVLSDTVTRPQRFTSPGPKVVVPLIRGAE